jgi:DNA-binding beta-propeller fold protein YncE
MTKSFRRYLEIGLLLGSALACNADYKIITRYPIGGTGGYDYINFEPTTRRLFVAHMKKVEVLNADTGKKLGEIETGLGTHGTAFAHEFNHGFITSGTTRTVTMFDLTTLEVLKRIKYMGENPDAIEYDPGTKRIYVANVGSTGDMTVIDPQSGDIKETVSIAPGGVLENISFDNRGRAFLNEESKSNIHVVDLKTWKEVARWSVAPGEGPTKGAIDLEKGRLFITCSNKTLAVLDIDSGKVVATLPIGTRPDGIVYDKGMLFVSNRDGTLTVIKQESADRYSVVQTVMTDPGCRTIAIDPTSGRVFMPTAKFGPMPEPTKEVPKPRLPVIPDTCEVVVVGK